MKSLIFVYLACYGGAVASLFNPFVGLLIYVCFGIIRPASLWPWAVPPGNYSLIVALGLLSGWALRGFGRWRLGRAWAVMSMLGLFGVWSAISASRAVADPIAAWVMAEEIMKIVLPIFVGISTIFTVQQLRILAWVIMLSEGYLALEFNLSYLSGYNRVQYEGFADLDNNGAAVPLVACLGVAFFLGLNERRWWLRGVALGAGLLMTHAVLLTFSRGGMLSMGITGLVAFLLVPKRPSYYAAFAVAVVIVLALAGPQVRARFQQTFVAEGEDASADSRRVQWAAALKSMQQTPLGVGPDQWRLLSLQFGLPQGQAVHSTWMQLGAEFGFPGLAAVLLYYLVCMARLRPLTRESTPVPDPWFRHLARMVIASLSGFLVAAQFVTIFKLEVPYYIALIGACLLKLVSPTDLRLRPTDLWRDPLSPQEG